MNQSLHHDPSKPNTLGSGPLWTLRAKLWSPRSWLSSFNHQVLHQPQSQKQRGMDHEKASPVLSQCRQHLFQLLLTGSTSRPNHSLGSLLRNYSRRWLWKQQDMKKEIQKFRGNLRFSFIHSKLCPSLHKPLDHCKARETAGSSWSGTEDFPMVLKTCFQLFI